MKYRNLYKAHFNPNKMKMWLFLVILTLPHMEPVFLNRFSIIEQLLDYWRLTSFTICLLWMLIKRKISIVTVLVGIWELYILIVTIISKGDIHNAILTAFSVLSVIFLYDLAEGEETFLSSQVFCFSLVIFINYITELLYPNGLYWERVSPKGPNWFLGYYNGYTKYCIPAILFALLYIEKTGKKLAAYFLIGYIILSAFKVYAGGFALTLASMFIVYLFFKNWTSIFNYYIYWLIQIVFVIGVFLLNVENMFSWLINDILGKAASLITRMNLWRGTLELIAKSPIIGHGIQERSVRLMEYNYVYGYHAHNLILELLYQGGVIGICLWSVLVILAGTKLYKYRYTKESKIISTAFLGWCIATLVEPFTTCFLMGMFIIAYHCEGEKTNIKKSIQEKCNYTFNGNGECMDEAD